MTKLNSVDLTAFVLIVIGAINWGLVGLLNFDLVASIFGAGSALTGLIYILVGLSGLYVAFSIPKFRRS